jgi:hypothetical protein
MTEISADALPKLDGDPGAIFEGRSVPFYLPERPDPKGPDLAAARERHAWIMLNAQAFGRDVVGYTDRTAKVDGRPVRTISIYFRAG